MPDKKEIINILNKIADLLEFKGESQFKIKAFRNGAYSILKYEDDIEKLIKEEWPEKVKGIGKSLQSVISEYYETGSSSIYDKLKKEVPAGIEDLFKIKGIGIKKSRYLYEQLGISNLGELGYACKENRISLLKGFGPETQKKIIQEIEKYKVYSKFILLSTAEKYSGEILKKISSLISVTKVAVTGQLRRGMEIISVLEFIILTKDIKVTCLEIKKHFECTQDNDRIEIKNGFSLPVFLYLATDEILFTEKLFYSTGSDDFITRLKSKASFSTNSEHEFFEKIKMPYVIPEMREKEYFDIPVEKLKANSDLCINHFKGLLHFHTTYSDGKDTLQSMLRKAEEMGFEYAAVCDHSKSVFYANGLSEDKILLQKEEVKRTTSQSKLHIFHGIESDILQDGSLDYSSGFLNNFDFIVASVHLRFNMEQDEMTGRIIKAVENPYTDLLGHPTGRLLLSREPYKVNIKKVIEACAANNVAIEINANPQRLDLDWRMLFFARDKGCMFSVNPDAHATEEIHYIKYGIVTGRKAGLLSKEVINCFELEKFRNYLKRKVERNLS